MSNDSVFSQKVGTKSVRILINRLIHQIIVDLKKNRIRAEDRVDINSYNRNSFLEKEFVIVTPLTLELILG